MRIILFSASGRWLKQENSLYLHQGGFYLGQISSSCSKCSIFCQNFEQGFRPKAWFSTDQKMLKFLINLIQNCATSLGENLCNLFPQKQLEMQKNKENYILSKKGIFFRTSVLASIDMVNITNQMSNMCACIC